MGNNPPDIPPPFDDTPPAVPDAPEPAREHSSKAMQGLALNLRATLLRSLTRVQFHTPIPAVDVTGRSFLVLGTANTPISQLVETVIPGTPFSVSVFNDADNNTRWLPAPCSVLANDDEFWFTPFQPTLGGTPINLLTEETAPVVPSVGLRAFLKITWEVDDTRPLVPDEPVYAVRVVSVEVVTVGYGDDPPSDDFNAGITYRPWVAIGPAVDGVRPVDYQTLGYCHFWIFVRQLAFDSSSVPSDDSSSSSSPPSHQACFAIRKNRKNLYPTWGMILYPKPTLRMAVVVTLQRGKREAAMDLPPEWTGSVEPGTAWVVCAMPNRHGKVPVLCWLENDIAVRMCSAETEKFDRKVTVQLAGIIAGAPTDIQYTDDAGREHNQKFWNTTP